MIICVTLYCHHTTHSSEAQTERSYLLVYEPDTSSDYVSVGTSINLHMYYAIFLDAALIYALLYEKVFKVPELFTK